MPTEIGTSPESFTQYGNDSEFRASAGAKWNLKQSELGKSRLQTPAPGLYAQSALSSPIFTHFSLLQLSSQIIVTSLKYEASPYSVPHLPLNCYIFTSQYFPQNFVLRSYIPTFGLRFRNQLQKITIGFVMSIRPPVRLSAFPPVRLPEWKKTLRRTSWLAILLKLADTFRFCLQPEKETSLLQGGLRTVRGLGSVVGIATGYGLDGTGIEFRWGARFSAPVQTGPGAHPASYTRVTGSFPGVKIGRGVTLTPNSLLVPW